MYVTLHCLCKVCVRASIPPDVCVCVCVGGRNKMTNYLTGVEYLFRKQYARDSLPHCASAVG